MTPFYDAVLARSGAPTDVPVGPLMCLVAIYALHHRVRRRTS